jgi:hypothetical protein
MSNDYLLQNLQHRLAMAENAIAYLTQRVNAPQAPPQQAPQTQSLQTAIPLQGRRPYAQHAQARTPQSNTSQASNTTNTSYTTYAQDQAPIPLSEILTSGEVVTFGIFTGRDENGIKTSTVLATFDGTDLTVTECATVPSLVGLKTPKAGEILFKFMNGLKETGLIENTFNALPWRLASVQRDGQKVTLSQLRALK